MCSAAATSTTRGRAAVTKSCGFPPNRPSIPAAVEVEVTKSATMLHSAAPQPFNMFPFGHPPQHPQTSHPGDMFSHPPTHHHTPQPAPQQPEATPKPRFLFKMPRVVPNQKEKFESDEFLKRHSREGEVSLKVRHTSWNAD